MRKGLLSLLLLISTLVVVGQQNLMFRAATTDAVRSEVNLNSSKAIVDSLHYDGAYNGGIGTNGAASFGCYAFWAGADIAEFEGNVINQVKLYISGVGNVSSVKIEVHHDQTSGAVYEQDFTPVEGWNVVDLNNPVVISSTQDYYIGYFLVATGGYPAGADAGPIAASGAGNWMLFNGEWDHLNDLGATLTYNWNIRAMVAETAELDLSLKSLDFGGITTDTEHQITGTVQNMGSTAITSFDIAYQVNDEAPVSMSVSDVSIESWTSYNFEFPEMWSAEPGAYDITVTISNINGGADNNAANDVLVKNVVIASGSTEFMPLFEHFTASSCPPCATINSTIFTADFIHNNRANATVIRYQVNWPGAGDPYYTDEVGTRVAYYGVGAVPSVFLNGRTESLSSTAALQNSLDAAAAKAAYFEMVAGHDINVEDSSVTLTIDITPYITVDNYTVHAVVMENETTENASTNGETEFQHVTMKMIPNANGTQVSFVAGEPQTLEFTADLKGTNIEEYTDLSIVAFIQDDVTKIIHQSTYSSTPQVVEFTVTDGTNPIEGALVTVNAIELTTDATGVASTNLPDGDYNFSVTKDGFENYAGTVNVLGAAVQTSVQMTPVGIGVAKAHLEVYPNPSNGAFTINVDGTYDVQVLNNLGQVVYNEKVESSKVINLSDLASGVYILTVKNNNKFATQNIVIK